MEPNIEQFIAEYFALQAMNAGLTAGLFAHYAVNHLSREEAIGMVDALLDNVKSDMHGKGYPEAMIQFADAKIEEYSNTLIDQLNKAYDGIGRPG